MHTLTFLTLCLLVLLCQQAAQCCRHHTLPPPCVWHQGVSSQVLIPLTCRWHQTQEAWLFLWQCIWQDQCHKRIHIRIKKEPTNKDGYTSNINALDQLLWSLSMINMIPVTNTVMISRGCSLQHVQPRSGDGDWAPNQEQQNSTWQPTTALTSPSPEPTDPSPGPAKADTMTLMMLWLWWTLEDIKMETLSLVWSEDTMLTITMMRPDSETKSWESIPWLQSQVSNWGWLPHVLGHQRYSSKVCP